MYQGQLDIQQVQQLIKPLVVSGIYKNEVSALNDIVLDFVKSKLEGYNTITEKFELKYKIGFNKFTASIKNTASMKEEDDWIDWKAAMEMKKAWTETLKTAMRNADQD